LRIAPPEAPVTGYMFGKGVYFADSSSKSANYCHADKGTNFIGVLLLCEVVLGKMLNRKQAEMLTKEQVFKQGCHSCFGEGQMGPSNTQKMDDGVIVPLGKLAQTGLTPQQTALMYHEYIIYDTSQLRTRYLLKIKFNMK